MKPIFMMLLALIVSGCSSETVSPDAVVLDVDFNWTEKDRGSTENPEIRVSGIPQGTKRFFVELVDLDNPGFSHGGGFAENDGSGIIRRGSIEGHYGGPSPPPPIIHRYEITVKAIDINGTIVGIGKKTKAFPPD